MWREMQCNQSYNEILTSKLVFKWIRGHKICRYSSMLQISSSKEFSRFFCIKVPPEHSKCVFERVFNQKMCNKIDANESHLPSVEWVYVCLLHPLPVAHIAFIIRSPLTWHRTYSIASAVHTVRVDCNFSVFGVCHREKKAKSNCTKRSHVN